MPVETTTTKNAPLFPLGQTVITPGALDAFSEAFGDYAPLKIMAHLRRHQCGDWGSIDPDDRGLNEKALEEGTRIFSVYDLPDHSGCGHDETRVWIITEWDRSYTTVLLPSEY
jgi:hypothetical protein